MMIRVKYPNGTTEMVRPPLLNLLIKRGQIQMFRRDNGWSILGEDPIRQQQADDYSGPERRTAQ